MMINIMAYALERKIRFIGEQRTEASKEYGEGTEKTKIVYYAKSDWQKWTLSTLERYGS